MNKKMVFFIVFFMLIFIQNEKRVEQRNRDFTPYVEASSRWIGPFY
jgi:hypothetical protein